MQKKIFFIYLLKLFALSLFALFIARVCFAVVHFESLHQLDAGTIVNSFIYRKGRYRLGE